MTMQSVNPATGEVLETFTATSAASSTASSHRATRHSSSGEPAVQGAGPADAPGGADLARAPGGVRPDDGARDGQADRPGRGRGREVRVGLRATTRSTPRRFLADAAARDRRARAATSRFDPLGVVLAVMPWNFPFWQVFRFAAPALMAGNAGVLKHASNVPRCALAIEEVFRDAGFPRGLFATLLVGPRRSPRLIADPRIARRHAHRQRARRAARSPSAAGRALKKTVLELGGSDPFIVLRRRRRRRGGRDGGADARLINSGQSCIAAKRFIVVERGGRRSSSRGSSTSCARAAWAIRSTRDTAGRPAGAAWICATTLHRQVEESDQARGAALLLGGEVPRGQGAFYPPTCSPRWTRACRPSTRRPSVRSPR